MNPYVITAEVRGDFSKVKKQMKEISSTTKITVDSEGVTKATVETKKFADAQGNAVTQTVKLNKEGEVLNKTTTTQAKKLNTLSSSFKATIKSALLFTAAYGTLNLVMNNSIQTILEVDKALTELKKVSSLDNESLDEYTKKLGAMGQEVARTRAEMIDMATEFVKSGYSEEDAAQLARTASLYQNIADEELEAGEAANFIISQMKAFNLTAEDSLHIIDAVNNVSNNTATSSADLATNIGKASAALAAGGNTYEDTLA